MFHLTTHAFFKALMFLGSGSVIHACHHEQDIFKYGGLRKRMPITAFTFLIGVWLFLELIFCLVTLVRMRFFSGPIILICQFSSLYAGAILTSLYMFRLYFITFEGQARSDHSSKAVENSFLMTGPLLILALLSIVGGYFSLYPTVWGPILVPT